MDPQFQELSERISRDVTTAVNQHVTNVVTAAEERLARQAKINVEAVREQGKLAEERLAHQAKVNVEAVKEQGRLAEERLTHQAKLDMEAVKGVMTAAEGRLAHQAKINVEAVKEQAKLAAEGYGATLEAINRRLDRIEKAVTDDIGAHDAVLKNHNERISALESRN